MSIKGEVLSASVDGQLDTVENKLNSCALFHNTEYRYNKLLSTKETNAVLMSRTYLTIVTRLWQGEKVHFDNIQPVQ